MREYLSRLDRRSFDEARERTLRDGLALSPAERLELSEQLWRELARGRRVTGPWTAGFETFDEYERWRRSEARAGCDRRRLRPSRATSASTLERLEAGTSEPP